MSLESTPGTDPVVAEPAVLPERWFSAACHAAFNVFDDPRFVAATTVVGGADRLIFTAGGLGFDVASFGATAFAESGFDSTRIHAGDLTVLTGRFRPGDVLIGIDSDSLSVAGALRAAGRAGVRTIAVTTRGLTIIDADILVQVPTSDSRDQTSSGSMLAYSLALALMAARLEPGTSLAREVGGIEQTIHDFSRKIASIAPALSGALTEASRFIFSGRGDANWVATALARQWNMPQEQGHTPAAFAVHASDIEEGFWHFNSDDVLIELDSHERAPNDRTARYQGGRVLRPQQTWAFNRQPATSPGHFQAPGTSSALAALVVFAGLSRLLGEITPTRPRPA